MRGLTILSVVAAVRWITFFRPTSANAYSHQRHGRRIGAKDSVRTRKQEADSRRRLQDWIDGVPPVDVVGDPKDCLYKGKTCTPSAAPSVSAAPSLYPSPMPSISPTTSPMPSTSHMPSAPPSVSAAPSFFPSPAPSTIPTSSPSLYPSPQPSITPTVSPSVSHLPSLTPSYPPTLRPTTAFPTVSSAPTRTARPTGSPTIDPDGFASRIITDSTGETGIESACRPAIPATAFDVYDQAVIFDYNLQLVPGSDVVLVMDYIASQLHRDLSETYLDCEYQLADGETPRDFYINALSSLPVDVVRDNTKTVCEDGVSDADCYLVDAAYLTKIFYLEEWRRRLQVNTDFSDDAVLESFNATLVQFFASGSLMSGMSTILNTSFVGITNTGENGDDDRTDDEPFTNDDVPNRRDDDTVAPVADTDRSLNGGAIAGSVVGAIVGVALLVSLVFFALFRRRDSNSKEASKPMDVTQPDISDFRDLMTDPSDERDDRAMLSAAADRSCVVSDDEGSILSGPYERQDFRHVAVILGDDQSFGSGFPLYEPDAFTKRINENNAEHQDPSFVKTDEILDSLHQADMMAQTRSKFGVRSTGSSSRERRGYGAPDTVQL